MVGQQIGPFQIEKELGSGAMGTVYRGTYTKSGQRVALKVMAQNLATNEVARARFEREAEILKQFNHPNIVRLFGSGKFQGMRYYAMEYIEGESLDHALVRRGRLGWQEVCVLGKQLCAALQHAHEHGVIHRDLKPSNLMILKDGTLKLTDFGIAKDLDVTQLTEANCTVGTASYMSPEQCRGERNLTAKSDLYSLGIVFYELLTGRKPFVCENVMDMFMAHVQGVAERPSRIVLDLPKWLDTLVVQLMEKKPEQRPASAAKVAEALDDILEKVEAQQSAGVEAAKRKAGERQKGEKIDETDRQAATALLGKKSRKKKAPPFYTRAWFVGAGVLGLVAALGLVLWLIFRPEPLDSLYRRAEKAMTSGDVEAEKRAREGPIAQYLGRGGLPDNEQTRKMREWRDRVDKREVEELLARMVKNSKIQRDGVHQEKAADAATAEIAGDLRRAEKLWGEVQGESGAGAWALVAGDRLRDLAWIPEQLTAMKRQNDRVRETRREDLPADPDARKAFIALRYELFDDLYEAGQQWEQLKQDTEKSPERRRWFLMAAGKVKELKGRMGEPSGDRKKEQQGRVRAALVEAEKLYAMGEPLSAGKLCLDLELLYGDHADEDLKAVASQAKTLRLSKM